MKKKCEAVVPGKDSNDMVFALAKHVSTTAGVPAQAGVLLEFCWDSVNSDIYVNNNGSTGWSKIVD